MNTEQTPHLARKRAFMMDLAASARSADKSLFTVTQMLGKKLIVEKHNLPPEFHWDDCDFVETYMLPTDDLTVRSRTGWKGAEYEVVWDLGTVEADLRRVAARGKEMMERRS